MSHADDPRYAQFDEMQVVLYWDRSNHPEVIVPNEDLARDYIAGQWSPEGYSFEPIKVIRSLPETRILYNIHARVRYSPAPEPIPVVDEYTEFPGLGNGEIVPIGEVTGDVSEQVPYGWNVSSWAWDLGQAQAEFDERMEEARRLRDERRDAFARFAPGCVVRTSEGQTMIRTADREGVLHWNAGPKMIHDANVDPSSLTVIAEA